MEYNTAREALLFSEYGRCIKQMVDLALKIEDKEKRSLVAKSIVKTMSTLNPQLKDMDNFQQKLYDHLFIISNFELDIDCPFPIPTKESVRQSPDKIVYALEKIRFRYYGKTLESMIQKACELPEGDEKNALLGLLAVQMKKSYYLWNDDILTDESVANHFSILSGGRLIFSDALKTDVYKNFYQKPSLSATQKKAFISENGKNGKRPFYKNKKRK